jgi:nucleoid-associated protein YgaU
VKGIIALSLALFAACGAVFVFGMMYLHRAPPAEATAQREPPAVAAAPAPASPAKDEVKSALSAAQTEATAALAVVTPAPRSTEEPGPAFDVARIDETGEAVIAGRAAPGATVELLRDGQPHDSAVADASGLFVMTPPPLPPGKYDLTLRSRSPDGTVVQSRRGVSVAVNDVAPRPSAVPPRVDVAAAAKPEATSSPVLQANAAAAPVSNAVSVQPRHPTASVVAHAAPDAIPRAAAGTATAAISGSPTTKVVSRGDSLWLISRLAYGDGMRYALIYKANRDRIRDPNRNYPGQTFVLPANAR